MLCRNVSVSCLQFSIGNSFNSVTNLTKKQHRFPSSFLSLLPIFANDTSCLDDISVSHEEGMAILKHPKPERSDSFLMAIKDWSVKPNHQIDSIKWPGEVQQTRSFMTLSKQLETQEKQIKATNSIDIYCQKISEAVDLDQYRGCPCALRSSPLQSVAQGVVTNRTRPSS